jgi:hypothetical protein
MDRIRSHVKTLEKMVVPIEESGEFFCMYDAMMADNSGFSSNRISLLDAWKRGGELYTLRIKETDELFANGDLRMALATFASPENPTPAWLQLPVLCWRNVGQHADACVVLWTATHCRQLGLAKCMLHGLGIKRVHQVLPESREFWEHMAIHQLDLTKQDVL